jgi:hypothetical protein
MMLATLAVIGTDLGFLFLVFHTLTTLSSKSLRSNLHNSEGRKPVSISVVTTSA